jgi:hypothetical protein
LKASQFSRNNCAEKLRHPTTRLGSVREKPGVSRSEIGQPDPLFFWIIACAALHPIFRRRVIYIVTLCIKIDEYWSSLHVKIRKLAK